MSLRSRCKTGTVFAGATLSFLLALSGPGGWAADPNPDLQAVQAVCGRCHSTSLFAGKPRFWERWNDVFADMTQRGATGTDEQLIRVTRYFLENLTLMNVNTAPADELTGVLGINEETAQAIVERRQQRPFENLKDLCSVSGVDSRKAEDRKERLLF